MIAVFDQIALWWAHRQHKREILKREEELRKRRAHPEDNRHV